jgi:hypothetical protein
MIMTPLITAVILTPQKIHFPEHDWKVYQHISIFSGLEGLHQARIDSFEKVNTPYCMWVDDDDELPAGSLELFHRLIALMQARSYAIGYTDSIVRTDGKPDQLDAPGPHKLVKHYTSSNYLHKAVVMRTTDALKQARALPKGLYWTESMIYSVLARDGAAYIPEVGYVWNKKEVGMHRHAQMGVAQRAALDWYLKAFALKLS